MTFEQRLKSLRLKNSMTQQSASVALGITARQYQRFESGEQRPGYENLIRIADLFDVSLDWLTGREERILGPMKRDKKAALAHFLSLFPDNGLDMNPEESKTERIMNP